MLLNQLMSQFAADDKPYIEELFSSYVYSGTGSTRTLTTGIDLTGGGMIWLKSRSAATDHAIYDTVRGATYDLASNLTTAQTTQATGVTGFGATGFSMGALAKINTNAATYAAWTFKKAAKFFDVVQFTAQSSDNQRVPHSLGCVPGLIIVKCYSEGNNGWVYHVSKGRDSFGVLNSTGAFSNVADVWGTSDPTSTDFGLKNPYLNTNGSTCIAYLWAHDDSADGVVQCGSFTTDASGNATVELGWEPQYLLVKTSSRADSWYCVDSARRFVSGPSTASSFLSLNSSSAEGSSWGTVFEPTASGFKLFGGLDNLQPVIYLAIRRGPMRVPTDGTTVYNAIARTGTSAAATITGVGFPVDAVLCKRRNGTIGTVISDRLRGSTKDLYTTATTIETTTAQAVTNFASMDGISVGTDSSWNVSGNTYIKWFFRRAPGFFDQVCDSGTGAAHTVSHNLKAVPSMIWRKGRSGATQWEVWHSAMANTEKLVLNGTAAKTTDTTAWNSTAPTASVFSVGTGANVNTSAATYATYLFGDSPGLCKSFSYTGNGTNQDISLGFAPRFVLIKRTDAAGDWKIFDSTRGIVSGNDPVLALNSTAAEVTTTDPIDPIATGFNITQEATNNLNVNGATYIGWSTT